MYRANQLVFNSHGQHLGITNNNDDKADAESLTKSQQQQKRIKVAGGKVRGAKVNGASAEVGSSASSVSFSNPTTPSSSASSPIISTPASSLLPSNNSSASQAVASGSPDAISAAEYATRQQANSTSAATEHATTSDNAKYNQHPGYQRDEPRQQQHNSGQSYQLTATSAATVPPPAASVNNSVAPSSTSSTVSVSSGGSSFNASTTTSSSTVSAGYNDQFQATNLTSLDAHLLISRQQQQFTSAFASPIGASPATEQSSANRYQGEPAEAGLGLTGAYQQHQYQEHQQQLLYGGTLEQSTGPSAASSAPQLMTSMGEFRF